MGFEGSEENTCEEVPDIRGTQGGREGRFMGAGHHWSTKSVGELKGMERRAAGNESRKVRSINVVEGIDDKDQNCFLDIQASQLSTYYIQHTPLNAGAHLFQENSRQVPIKPSNRTLHH